jgi:4-carboxymuconolactone decarboxylase
MSERYLRGVEILQQIGLTGRDAAANRVAELAPDFARMAIEFPYGDLWSRSELNMPTRELAAIAALAALGNALPQLRTHVTAALNLGSTRQQIIEILMQTAIYAGFPAALNAIEGCQDLLTDGECYDCQAALAKAAQL